MMAEALFLFLPPRPQRSQRGKCSTFNAQRSTFNHAVWLRFHHAWMNRVRTIPSWLALMTALWLTLISAHGAERTWHAVPGGRYADLQVAPGGKTGFTLLAPDQTRILFTNTLQEAEGASNRVLFNGSGVAAGDFDGDGWPDLYFCSLNGQNTLFKNLGGWRFADVTEQAGLKRDRR